MTASTTKHAATLAALLMIESGSAKAKRHARDRGRTTPPHPEVVAADALALLRIGKGVARWAVRACNGEGERYWQDGKRWAWRWDDTHDAAHAKADAKALAKLHAIADHYGATVKLGGDPRGYVVKLILASGRHNTWGGAESGWGVA